jgi:hypothetical protein
MMEFHDMDGGAPEHLRPLFGKTVEHLYVVPGGMLFFILAGGSCVTVEAMEGVIGYKAALEVRVGTANPGVDWADIRAFEQIECKGWTFTDMDGDRLVFGEHAVQVTTTRVNFLERCR